MVREMFHPFLTSQTLLFVQAPPSKAFVISVRYLKATCSPTENFKIRKSKQSRRKCPTRMTTSISQLHQQEPRKTSTFISFRNPIPPGPAPGPWRALSWGNLAPMKHCLNDSFMNAFTVRSEISVEGWSVCRTKHRFGPYVVSRHPE